MEASSNEEEVVTEAVEAVSKEEEDIKVLLTHAAMAATVDITKIKAKTKVTEAMTKVKVTEAMTKVVTEAMTKVVTGVMVMKEEEEEVEVEEVVVEATIGTEVFKAEAGNRNNNIELKFKISRVPK